MNRRFRQRNHRNQIGFPWVAYATGLGLIVLGWGSYYAYLKNQYHLKKAVMSELRGQAAELQEERDVVARQLAIESAPNTLGPRIEGTNSGLVPIPPESIIRLGRPVSGGDSSGTVASNGRGVGR